MLGFLVILLAFLVWELSGVLRTYLGVGHLSLSEYVWRWTGSSRWRKAFVLVATFVFGVDLALHFAFHTSLTWTALG